MQMFHGTTLQPLSAETFSRLRVNRERVAVDVGTGDGAFVVRLARAEPGSLCVGVDALAEAMEPAAFRVSRKPQRGGVENARFVVAAAEDLPGVLAGVADRIYVNYPWGSLLRAIMEPDPGVVAGIAAIGRMGAEVTVLLNQSVIEDAGYCSRLGLPSLDHVHGDAWAAGCEAAGLRILERHTTEPLDVPHHTGWGRRLTRGARRKTLLIRGTRV